MAFAIENISIHVSDYSPPPVFRTLFKDEKISLLTPFGLLRDLPLDNLEQLKEILVRSDKSTMLKGWSLKPYSMSAWTYPGALDTPGL